MTENYRGCYEYLSAQFEQVGGYDFYRELFPDNELYGVKYDDFSHPSAVYLYQGEDERLHRRKMYHDTWEKDYTEFVEQKSLDTVQRILSIAGIRTGWSTHSG